MVLLLPAACDSGGDAVVGDGPTSSGPGSSPNAGPTTTSATATTGVRGAGAQAATASCPAIPARRGPDADRPRYRLAITVDLARGVVEGDLDVEITPDRPVGELVFRLWPNGPRPASGGTRLAVGKVRVDNAPGVTGVRPDPTTLVVPLSPPRTAGSTIRAFTTWQLTLPTRPTLDRIARTGDTLRLGSFFPILPWEPGVGWAREPSTRGFAEASTVPTADFAYTVTVPAGVDVMASGEGSAAQALPDRRLRRSWTAIAVRDIAVSVGHFRQVSGMAGPVRVVVGVDRQVAVDPAPILDLAVRSMRDFSGRYGAYPWPSYTVSITPNLRGGIEYPGHVMQGPATANRTTPHEVAHMWFYGLVGDDQGRDPWLDEGLATWAEARFLGNVQSFRTRAIPAGAAGHLGEPMTYWEQRLTTYYRGVYAQGAKALANLGPGEQVDCALRHYVAVNAHRIARPADLLRALGTVFPDAEATLRRFGAIS